MGEDGRKIGKRWGSVINPGKIVNEYGADSLQVYEMFAGRPAPGVLTLKWLS